MGDAAFVLMAETWPAATYPTNTGSSWHPSEPAIDGPGYLVPLMLSR